MGKLYPDIKAFAAQVPACVWSEYKRPDKVWRYLEFGDRRGNWKKGRRALLTRPLAEDGQWLLEFARPDTLLYTNLGMGEDIDVLLQTAGLTHWTEPEHVIRLHHSRGGDELVHRALKEFGSETLPFKRFAAKIVRTGGRRILKVTRATWNELQIPKLWALSRAPPRFAWA